MGSVQHGLPRRQPQPQITARRCQTDRENLGSWHALVTLHKRRHRAQLYPGKDKCGERNCLISKTTEKCVRVRAGNGGWKHRDSTERLAEGPGRPAGVASNNRDGAVSGPSEGGAVSLAPTRMSPFDKSKDGLCFPKTGSCVLCLVLRRHSNYCSDLDESLGISPTPSVPACEFLEGWSLGLCSVVLPWDCGGSPGSKMCIS